MKLVINAVLISFCILLSQNLEAQILKKVKKDLKGKIESVTQKEKEKKQKAEEKSKKEKSNPDSEMPIDLEGMMGNIMKPVNTADSYTFDIVATIELTEYGKEESQNQITQGYGKGVLWMEVDEQSGAIVYDMNNKAMVILNDEKKEAQALSMDLMNLAKANQPPSEKARIDIRKTGKRKVIHDYECEEYLFSHDEGQMEIWFTPDVPFDYDDYLMSFTKIFNQMANDQFPSDKGYVMEMYMYDQKGVMTNDMKVLSISEEVKTITMSDYEIKKMF